MKVNSFDEYKFKKESYMIQGLFFSFCIIFLSFFLDLLLDYYWFISNITFFFTGIFIVFLWIKVYFDIFDLNNDNIEFCIFNDKLNKAQIFINNIPRGDCLELKKLYIKKR